METNGHQKSNEAVTKETERQSSRIKALPPHIAWPLFVVGLLVLGVTYSMWVVFASRSDGGVQIIENYYEKAVDWDNRQKIIQASEAMGWHVEITPEQASSLLPAGGLRVIFKDSAGLLLEGLTATVKASRPQTTRVIREMELQSVSGAPGEYFHQFPEMGPGLWDFEITADKDTLKFVRMIRKELVY